ncbi:CopD family protein [Pseudomonas sp. HR96]|uniref:CopD family protein n=1 Tax=Pseudomonas sp. HR96 TaxID=1027966 RepID=UPI002A754449|nr:CopD family protein [Pseudomonas sp. HR96]WPO99014.1 CopD family protein [Pseudomonas sp. HR96]
MSFDALLYTVHLLAALIWVGGMFFAWTILRPAAIAALPGPQRLQLWAQVLPRFFVFVWLAVAILPISGVAIVRMRFSGLETAPHYVQVMMGLYLVMVAIFLRIQTLLLPELRKAVLAEDWPAGAAVMGTIRRWVGVNLLVGLAVVMVAGLRI